MPAERRLNLMGAILAQRPDEPVVLYYKARSLAEAGDAAAAASCADALTRLRPHAPRVRTLIAHLAAVAERQATLTVRPVTETTAPPTPASGGGGPATHEGPR
jgi:hypothetical protein